MITFMLKILSPIIDLIFKAIGRSEKRKKNYQNAVDSFQDIEQTTLSEEESALREPIK